MQGGAEGKLSDGAGNAGQNEDHEHAPAGDRVTLSVGLPRGDHFLARQPQPQPVQPQRQERQREDAERQAECLGLDGTLRDAPDCGS